MNNDLKVRRLQLRDLFFTFKLRNENSSLKWFHSNADISFIRHFVWFAQRLIFKRNHTFIACRNSRAVGICYISSNLNSDYAFLSVNVDTSFRRTGIGDHLLRYAIDAEKDRGIGKLKLRASIHKDNLASLKLFQRVGFKEVTEGDHITNFILFEKRV